MDWCLNGPAVQDSRGGWMDNICLYVDGLECPQVAIGTPDIPVAPVGGPDGGPGLPSLPEGIDDADRFNAMFGTPNHELFDELILAEPGEDASP